MNTQAGASKGEEREPLPVMICGARGRMGQALVRIAANEHAVVRSAVDLGDDPRAQIGGCKVVIDFSVHTVTADLAALCAQAGVAMVIGTTGHTEAERGQILAHANRVPIVWAGNYSIGVNLLFHLTETAARILGTRYQAEIMEIHHRHKVDAPSGTALDLAAAVRAAPDFADSPLVHGRQGHTGKRPDAEIGLHALRGGEVIGEHTVFFFGESDRLELSHRASDRTIFARGAYRAAHWVVGQPPGLYNMRDVLGLAAPKDQPL